MSSSSRHNILKNTITLGALTAFSRVLGLIREMLQAHFIGAGVAQSAFTLAFALPNMARKLFGEGALTAAFIPIFKSETEHESLEKAALLARAVFTSVLVALLSLLALSFITLDATVYFRHLFKDVDDHRFFLTIRLIKILLPYMLFICGAAFGIGVLNALGKFKAAGLVPSLLNVFWIGALGYIAIFSDLTIDQRIQRVAIAILIAGASQMAFILTMMKRAGVSPMLKFTGWRNPKVITVWKNLGLAAIGVGAVQINYLLDQLLAQLASPWAAGVIGYAERLMDLPLGIIGVSFGTVLLPTFAGFFAKNDLNGARVALRSSMTQLLFVMIPAAFGLALLAPEITRVIYEGGCFNATDTTRVSRALAVYAVGLGFFGLQKTLIPWFQAQGEMKTPLRVSFASVFLNAALNIAAVFLLPVEWRHVGLAASTVFCSFVGCVFLVVLAHKKNGTLGLSKSLKSLIKIIFAAVVMSLLLIFLKAKISTHIENKICSLAILLSAGIISYFSITFLMGMRARKKII